MAKVIITIPNGGGGTVEIPHNELDGLQGAGPDYIHLNQEQSDALDDMIDKGPLDIQKVLDEGSIGIVSTDVAIGSGSSGSNLTSINLGNEYFGLYRTVSGESVGLEYNIGSPNELRILDTINEKGLVNADDYTSNQLINDRAITDVGGIKQLIKNNKFINKDIVYVDINGNDLTAEIGNSEKCFKTLDAACDALPLTGGTIIIGLGRFISPLNSKIKSNTIFIGSGKPITDSIITITGISTQPLITSPTKLIGGTILEGTFDGSLRDGIQLYNLGVDCGEFVCNTYYGGIAQEGIFFAQLYNPLGGLPSSDGQHQLQTLSAPRTGIIIENVSSLCKTSMSPVHAMLIENTIDAKISNITTYYGVFGLVIKSIGCNVINHDGHGHAWAGLIVKSNDYAYGINNNISNIYLTSIGDHDGSGVWLWAEEGIITGLTNISNVNIKHVQYGFKNTGANLSEGFNITNVSIYDTVLYGIDFNDKFTNSSLTNIDQRGSDGYGIKIYQNNFTVQTRLSLINISTSENTNKGLDLSCTNLSAIYTEGLVSSDNIGGDTISGFVYGNNIYNYNSLLTGSLLYKNSGLIDNISSIGTNGVINKSLAKIDNTGSINTPGDITISRGTGNPALYILNETSGSFPLIGFNDQRIGGAAWNIECGRTLGTLGFLNSINGDVIKFLTSGGAIFTGEVSVAPATIATSAVQLQQLPTILTSSATLDFPNTAPSTSSELTITVTGATDGDVVSLGVPNASTTIDTCFTARVSSANTVTVKFNNYSAVSVDPASGVFKVKVFK